MKKSILTSAIYALYNRSGFVPSIRTPRVRKRQQTPHQGAQEKARRVRQLAKGII